MNILSRKLVIVGDTNCGKTALLLRFQNKGFDEKYYCPTVFDNYAVEMHVGNKTVNMKLSDTAGCSPDYDRLRPLGYPGSNIALLCYKIDDSYSLDNITEKWNKEVEYFLPGVRKILVGIKTDLRSDPATLKKLASGNKVYVEFSEGDKIAKQIGADAFMECSAKTNEGVKELLETAARIALKSKKGWKNKVPNWLN